MEKFEEYLNNLRTTVKREPATEAEKGFQTAVVLIHAHYVKNKIKEK